MSTYHEWFYRDYHIVHYDRDRAGHRRPTYHAYARCQKSGLFGNYIDPTHPNYRTLQAAKQACDRHARGCHAR